MTATTTTAIIFVTYPGNADTRFDRSYYLDTHLPLVRSAWQRHGLESATAFFPAVAQGGTIAIAELRFQDEDAMYAALASADTPEVMKDIPLFTDVDPVLVRALPL